MSEGSKMGSLLFVMMLPLAILATGCSSDPPKRPPVESNPGVVGVGGVGGGRTDGGTSVSDSGASNDSGTSCTELVNSGAVVDQVAVADTFPPGLGGTIEDGTYVLSDAKVYVGLTGQPGLTNASYQGTISIIADAFERILLFKSSGGATTERRVSGTLTPNGVNATIVLACPSTVQEQVTFSVSTNTLMIGNSITGEVFTFTKKL